MTRTLTAAGAVILLATLTACGSSSSGSSDSGDKADIAAGASKVTASSAFTQISSKVTSAKVSGEVTADSDPNHLLGRPNQYTSKITFSDSRIKAADVAATQAGDVDRGGAVEVFATAGDAQNREKYIQAVTKSLPALAEYDYLQGTVLVRVSHYLTPAQATAYQSAVDSLS
ncbi:hypothetical protein BIV25_42980 [Streptomyces sp. MUSC 14]|uniref:hypothetical protein n=1 Tax=Streptomyces sp. MUSC 14 TaxID=1354889 RepID=UPI0008F5DEBE|nr:hypothetical protein [Streptomyces sp. MUSC 14]OIJ85751.1 hypothetical protein BIV25_42980 [Streptomyces sp. MUSC 14]